MVIGTQQKNRRHLPRCLLQKIIHSDFLRRHYPHQVKGSKFGHFLSACFTSSPVFDCDCILHPLRTNCKRGQRRAQWCKTFFTQFLGRFTQVLLKKKVNYGILKVDAYPPPVSKKEEFRMKQTTFAQRLTAALVALCMVLSVCAPALAADDRVIWIQKNGGTVEPLNAGNIGTKLPGCRYAYDGTTVTITMAASQGEVMEGVTLAGGPSTDIVLVCTNNTRMDGGLGLTITGMRNVTIKTEDASKEYTGAFYGALKVTDCHGNVTVTNPHGAAVVYSLDVDNTAGTGNVTITGSRADGPICAVAGNFGNKVNIASNGDVKIENIVSGMFGAQLRYQAVDGELTVTNSKSVTTTGGASKVDITSTGAVEIKSNDTKNVVGNGLSVNAGDAVTVTGGGADDAAAAIKGDANITAVGGVNVSNFYGIAVDGNLTIDSSTGVTVVGNTRRNAIRFGANITSSGAVNISNSRGIAVGGKLTVKNASGTGDVTVTGTGNATLNNGADITSRGAVSITNTGSGLAVSGDLTVHDSGSVKVSGGNASAPAVDGNITLTSSDKMELSNPKGQVTSKKLTVKNSTGEVSVTGNKSDGSALVQGGASIGTTGTVTITNSSGPAIFGGLNVEQSGGITVTGSRASEPIITGNSTIKNTNKVEIINNEISGKTAQNITYTPPAGKGYFYQTTQNGSKLHTRSAISSTTPYLCIEPDTLYTLLTQPEGVTAKTNGISDTSFYAGEMVTVTAPADTDTKKFEKWTFSGKTPSDLSGHWETKNPLTFTMPEGNVTLTADYKQLYNLTVTGGTIVDGNGDTGNYLPGTEVTVVFTESGDITKQFEKWTYTGTAPAKPDGGWTAANDSTSKTFTFKMPAGNVTLTADYMQLYNLTVKGGTIVNGATTGISQMIVKPGQLVTVAFTGSTGIEDQFEKWTLSGTKPTDLPNDWQSKPSFSFTMPAGNVTLKAEYKTVYNVSVADSRGTVLVNNKERSRALEGETVTVKTSDTFFNAYHQFNGWSLSDDSAQMVEPSENWQTSKEFTFTMPAGNVTLKADYKQLYDLAVTGGTIVDESGDTGETTGIYLPGTEVTIQFTESDDITKQFKQWKSTDTEPEAPDGGWTEENNSASKTFTFKMPAGDVTLEAVYRETYHLSEYTNKAEFFVNDQQVHQAPAGVRVTVKLVDGFINDHREFDQWLPAGGTALVAPEEGWAHKPSFSFIMPEGSVLLQVHTTFLYDVNVTHGTIVDGTGDTGTSKKIVKPGQPVTVRAESTEENPFLQWTYTGKAPAAPDGGWPEGGWQTSPEFTFKMPNGNVTLDAQLDQLYKVSINDSLGIVTINGEPRSSLWVKEGETVTVATTLKDGYWMEFEKWNSTGTAPEEPEGGWTETNKSTSTTFTFKMPNGPVELVAQWSASPVARPDPDEPLDEDFGVEPAPMDTTGGTIAAVAVGGAAIWGGYEIATRVILHSLLPEGTVIPASRGQLALLVWNTAGRPEPAGAPAFADVTDPDMAKAAQWCTEQGTMAAKGDRFEPEGWTPKFKVIEVWNKAFPAA